MSISDDPSRPDLGHARAEDGCGVANTDVQKNVLAGCLFFEITDFVCYAVRTKESNTCGSFCANAWTRARRETDRDLDSKRRQK